MMGPTGPTGPTVPVYARSIQTLNVLNAISEERGAQDEKWGVQNHPDGTGNEVFSVRADLVKDRNTRQGSLTWLDILEEEFWEAAAETDLDKLEAELVQVAAVAAAWVESIRRRRDL